MGIIRKEENAYLIYEEQELGQLVAIHKDDQKAIKKYWKSKDKSAVEQLVKGFPFVMTEEQETLKIDFSEAHEYTIAHLKKFS